MTSIGSLSMIEEQSVLLSLSPEIVLLILELLHDRPLLAVACVCRSLHYLALPTYLSRYGISTAGPQPPSLVLKDRSLAALPGLCTALSISSLDALSCTFDGPHQSHFIRSVRGLLRFVSRLTQVNTVTLNVGCVDARWIDGLATASSKAWKPTFVRLLNAIIERGCTALNITHGHFIVSISPHLGPPSKRDRAFRAARTLLGLQRHPAAEASDAAPPPPLHHLQSFSLHSNLLLSQPFCDWTLYTLNGCNITALSIRLSGLPSTTWALILPAISLPAMTTFTAETSDIAFPDLLAFLARHPALHTLNLHPQFSYPDAHAPVKPTQNTKKRPLLPHLATLGGSPRNVAALLAQLHPAPRLHTVTLVVPMRQRVFQPTDLAALNAHITDIVHYAQPRTLALRFAVPCETAGSRAASLLARTAGGLHSVETLALGTDGHFAFVRWVAPALPAWLAGFPALRQVRLAPECVPGESVKQARLLSAVKESCPGVLVSIGRLDE
ncbi:hypothetical protein H0H81_007347 [Sphagnurus paluster]|uniref:F-box domain-containing protein n=1 Tax=Sphagnurus paluster TaxID=117069 RepID=A0A9P7FR46_9AGAR|nr:hypothetical protein H0H81_007347 [Sphagnurus paluster]